MNILKDILIVAHISQVPGEAGNGRFNYIAEKIDNKNANVEIVTSKFSHLRKSQRSITEEQRNNCSYKITMLDEPAYRKNVSLKRIYSHYIMGRNLKKYLKNREKPDIIYCVVPSLDLAKVAAKYADENNIRFIIDVQDLWPEAFKMVFNLPVISNVLFYPMKKQANYIYAKADEIIAVSQTYVDRALEVNKECKSGHSVYLGTDLNYFDQLAKKNKCMDKPKDEIWLAYIGTLGHSYDLISVIDSLKILKDKGINNIKFIVMGDGPLKSKFEEHAKENDIYVEFTGRLDYGEMVGILTVCDIAVNPISHGSAASIINKHGDYAAAGLPVINTQESQEYRNLLNEFSAGSNCENNNPRDLADKLLMLCRDDNLRKDMGENSRKLAEEKFDREKTYSSILNLLLK